MFVILAFIASCCIVVDAAAFVTSASSPSSSLCQPRSNHIKALSSSPTASSSSQDTPSESSSTKEDEVTLTVALTRELGKNSKIKSALENHPTLTMLGIQNLHIVEMPCIKHARGDDLDDLIQLIKNGGLKEYEYVVVTSPEAAKVLGQAIQTAEVDVADVMKAKVVAVGKATEKSLQKECNLSVDFVPSKANGETLAVELPPIEEGDDVTRVLYPASAKAADTIQDGLQSRSDAKFEVTRLNTYDTIPATFDEEQIQTMMEDVDIALFGSPSAVEAWLGNVDVALGIESLPDEDRQTAGNGDVLAACIGTTTARACLESRRWEARKIYYPKENPGMDGWADSAAQALGDTLEKKFWGGGW